MEKNGSLDDPHLLGLWLSWVYVFLDAKKVRIASGVPLSLLWWNYIAPDKGWIAEKGSCTTCSPKPLFMNDILETVKMDMVVLFCWLIFFGL